MSHGFLAEKASAEKCCPLYNKKKYMTFSDHIRRENNVGNQNVEREKGPVRG